jgi:hypothetical protein
MVGSSKTEMKYYNKLLLLILLLFGFENKRKVMIRRLRRRASGGPRDEYVAARLQAPRVHHNREQTVTGVGHPAMNRRSSRKVLLPSQTPMVGPIRWNIHCQAQQTRGSYGGAGSG